MSTTTRTRGQVREEWADFIEEVEAAHLAKVLARRVGTQSTGQEPGQWMPHVCRVPEHGPLAHKHAGSGRWFYKPEPERREFGWWTALLAREAELLR